MGEKTTFQSFVLGLKDVVRNEVQQYNTENKIIGSTQILITPRMKEADDWLVGLSDFDMKQNLGTACVPLPGDPITYGFTFDLQYRAGDFGPTPKKFIGFKIQKKSCVKLDDAEGSVTSYKNWADIGITVSSYYADLTKEIEEKVAEYVFNFFSELDEDLRTTK